MQHNATLRYPACEQLGNTVPDDRRISAYEGIGITEVLRDEELEVRTQHERYAPDRRTGGRVQLNTRSNGSSEYQDQPHAKMRA